MALVRSTRNCMGEHQIPIFGGSDGLKRIDNVCARHYTERGENMPAPPTNKHFSVMSPGRVSTLSRMTGHEEDSVVMTYVITQPCVGVKDASCVDVCPVDCIHPTQNEPEFETCDQLFINPDECIDCGACEPACPVTAIFEESAVPEEWRQYIKINADFFK